MTNKNNRANLRNDRKAAPGPNLAPMPAIGAFTRKGTRAGKSVNEDAFLVAPIAEGQLWLLAIADGVTNSEQSWWASNKCMELLWRSRSQYERELLDVLEAAPSRTAEKKQKEIMKQWLQEIHKDFVQSRRKAPTEFQKATSTLTYAVVCDRQFFWAHCGDTRLYKLPPSGSLSKVIADRFLSRDKDRKLANHIGASSRDWEPIVGQDAIPANGLLILCSDGLISGNEKLQKTELLKTLRYTQGNLQKGNLQKRVVEITERVADGGETDDLTSIAFQPREN